MTRRGINAVILPVTMWHALLAPGLIGASSAAQAPPADNSAWLRLLVHQPGRVYLDGTEFLNLTGAGARRPIPWTSYTISLVAIAAGPHRVEMKPSDALALPPWESVELVVAAGETLTVRLAAPRVITSPPGARVLLDGEELGPAPLRIDPTRLPGHRVLVELPGYQRRTLEGDSLLDQARTSGSVRIELDPLTLRPVARLEPPPPTSWIGRHRTLALTGSTILLAGGVAAGIHFKNQADDLFERYEKTGNAHERERLFGKAQQNDRMSLVGWGLGEAALFATFFLLISETPRGLVPNPGVPEATAARAMILPVAPDGEPGVTIGVTRGF